MPRENYLKLISRVENGATLYVSNDNGILAQFENLSGLRVTDACIEAEAGTFTLDGKTFGFERTRRYEATSVGAKILATDNRGLPIISEYAKGKGRVIYANFPLESTLINRSNAFDSDDYLVYSTLFRDVIDSHEVKTDSAAIGITLHDTDDGEIICAAINYTYAPVTPNFKVADGYKVGKVLYGSTDTVAAFDGVIFKLTKA
jgi:hypothetical protein